MFSILGYVSTALLIVLVMPYVLRVANKKYFKNNDKVKKVVKELKKWHKPAGVLLAIVSLVHGYMAFGGFRLHTGSLLYLAIFVVIVFGALFGYKKKKIFLDMHKAFVVVAVILLAVHLLFPSALYYLMS